MDDTIEEHLQDNYQEGPPMNRSENAPFGGLDTKKLPMVGVKINPDGSLDTSKAAYMGPKISPSDGKNPNTMSLGSVQTPEQRLQTATRIPLSTVLPEKSPTTPSNEGTNPAQEKNSPEVQEGKISTAEYCEAALKEEYNSELKGLDVGLRARKITKAQLASEVFDIEPNFRKYLLAGETPNPQLPTLTPAEIDRISLLARDAAVPGLGLQYIRDFSANDTDPRTLREAIDADKVNLEQKIANAQASGEINDSGSVDDLRKVIVTLQGQRYNAFEANEILLRLENNL